MRGLSACHECAKYIARILARSRLRYPGDTFCTFPTRGRDEATRILRVGIAPEFDRSRSPDCIDRVLRTILATFPEFSRASSRLKPMHKLLFVCQAGRGIRDWRIGGGGRRILHESRGRREAKHEGVFALQAGLVPALAFQVVLNGIRLGAYKTAQRYELIVDKHGNTDVMRTALVSGTAGCVGAVLGSPFYLVKTQLQAQSAKSIAVGYQHDHSGSWDAFKFLWKEGGVAALYRGWNANMPRVFVGSATQLTTFGLASDWLRSLNIFPDRPILLTFLASAIGGSCVAITMQPFDVLATRLYNQQTDAAGRGTLYNGLVDALVKIFRTEGLTGLYKGTFPTWMRIAPHTVLCLVFYEQLDQLYAKFRTRID